MNATLKNCGVRDQIIKKCYKLNILGIKLDKNGQFLKE